MTATGGALGAIDHPLIGVDDLEAAHAAWRRLGFTVTPRGRHSGWGTANYCIMFGRDYIELLGILDAAQFTNNLDQFLAERGQGLLGLAFHTRDAEATRADLDAAGLSAGPVQELSRLLELPQEAVQPAFRLAHLTPGILPVQSAFACQHLTPALLRQSGWLMHANGALALEGVTIPVEDPATLTSVCGTLFGPDAVRPGQSRLDVKAGPHVLRFVAPSRLLRRYPDIPGAGTSAVITVLSSDLEATASFLTDAGETLTPVTGHRIVVPATSACGVILEFSQT